MSQKSNRIESVHLTSPSSNIYIQKMLATSLARPLKRYMDKSKYLANGKKKA